MSHGRVALPRVLEIGRAEAAIAIGPLDEAIGNFDDHGRGVVPPALTCPQDQRARWLKVACDTALSV